LREDSGQKAHAWAFAPEAAVMVNNAGSIDVGSLENRDLEVFEEAK